MIKRMTAAVIVFALLFSYFSVVAEAGSNDSPRIISARGSVFVHRVGGQELSAVYRGMNIYDGDVIITGLNATATVSYYQQTITMGELTKLSINYVWQRHGRNNSAVTLVEGMIKVRVDMQLGDDSHNMVQAAGTLVGVRGTEYVLIYRRMMCEDGEASGNPFVRLLVIEGEVVVDLPDPYNEGEVASYIVTPQGMFRLTEDIQGRQSREDIHYIPDMFVVPLELLDLSILEALRDDPRALAGNPELFARIEEAIEWRMMENELRARFIEERPEPQIIFASEAEEVLPTLPEPEVRGEPVRGSAMVSSSERAVIVGEALAAVSAGGQPVGESDRLGRDAVAAVPTVVPAVVAVPVPTAAPAVVAVPTVAPVAVLPVPTVAPMVVVPTPVPVPTAVPAPAPVVVPVVPTPVPTPEATAVPVVTPTPAPAATAAPVVVPAPTPVPDEAAGEQTPDAVPSPVPTVAPVPTPPPAVPTPPPVQTPTPEPPPITEPAPGPPPQPGVCAGCELQPANPPTLVFQRLNVKCALGLLRFRDEADILNAVWTGIYLENTIVIPENINFTIPSFVGTMEGNGHTINFTAYGSGDVGLFGTLTGSATIHNLNVVANVSGTGANSRVGAIVGHNNGGTINGVTVSAGSGISGGNNVGGIVGYNSSGSVNDSFFYGTITAPSGSYVDQFFGGGTPYGANNTPGGTIINPASIAIPTMLEINLEDFDKKQPPEPPYEYGYDPEPPIKKEEPEEEELDNEDPEDENKEYEDESEDEEPYPHYPEDDFELPDDGEADEETNGEDYPEDNYYSLDDPLELPDSHES